MAILDKDELNMPLSDDEDIEEILYEYFREMNKITDEQVEDRVDIAKQIYNLIAMFLFLVSGTAYTNGVQDIDYYVLMLQRRFKDIIGFSDSYTESYVNFITLEIVNTTFENLETEYYLSKDRALDIAETEANTIMNYSDYQNAINNGFTKKQWLTEKDNKVRKSHRLVDNKVVGIKDYFKVGGDMMLFPHDLSMNPKAQNVIGCRCHIKYSN